MLFETVRQLFDYDPETGIFRYRVRQANIPAGSIAGTVIPAGYRLLSVFKKRLYAHRVAWLYVHGHLPTGEIDHKNGNKNDNRISNLREATSSQNKMNRQFVGSGYKGVARHHTGKWIAAVGVRGSRRHIGLFDTPEEAHNAYFAAASARFGEFARAS